MKFSTALCTAIWLLALSVSAGDDTFEEGKRLWLPFDKVVDGKVVDPATGVVCQATGKPPMQDGGILASQFNKLSVPKIDLGDVAETLTLSAWIAPAGQPRSYETILFKGKRQGSTNQQSHFCLSLFDGRPEFKFTDEHGDWKGILRSGDHFSVAGSRLARLSEVPAVQPARWNHVAATFDRGHISLYLNGKETLSGGIDTKRLIPNDHPLLIGEGRSQSGHRAMIFTGLLGNVRLYDRALSGEQLRRLYEQERAGKPAGKLTIAQPLPEGYDPDFQQKLAITAEYEKRIPPTTVSERNCRAAVGPHRGAPGLFVNGKPVYPMMFMPSVWVDTEQTFNASRDFAAAGVDLFSDMIATNLYGPCHDWWQGVGRYDFQQIDDRMGAIVKANPNARILIRLKLDPPSGWWHKDHPGHTPVFFRDGEYQQRKGWTSLASKEWEALYSRMLKDFVTHVESSKYAAHIIGYLPGGGSASEWYYHGQDRGMIDYSPVAQERFREFVEHKYRDIAAVNAAWRTQFAGFSEVHVPTPAERRTAEIGLLRDPLAAGACVDYFLFLNDISRRNMLNCARIIKEKTNRTKLVGYFYGYLPLARVNTWSLLNNGHCCLGQVVNSPDIDFFCTPTDYSNRRGGEPGFHIGNFNGTFFLHNRLFWDEADLRTHFHPKKGECGATDNLAETLTVMQRAFGYTLAKGNAIWWFALAGNAYFHDQAIMEQVARFQDIGRKSMTASKKPVAEVALLMDETSIAYLSYRSSRLIKDLIRGTYTCTTKAGTPCDMYLTTDLQNPDMPDYKVYVFPNLFYADADMRAAIERKAKRNNAVVVWLYASGLLCEKGAGVENMAGLTGMSFKMAAEAADLQMRIDRPLGPIGQTVAGFKVYAKVSPSFEVADAKARVIGTVGGKPALAVKQFDTWRSVYSLTPLTPDLLREICDYAGVHVYSRTNDVLAANAGFIMLHTCSAGEKAIRLPGPRTVTELLSGRKLGDQVSLIKQSLPAQATAIYQLEQ